MSAFEGYRCGSCGREVPAGSAAGECPACAGPLLAAYDLGLLRRKLREGADPFRATGGGVWRWAPLLPDVSRRISLGEGNTPVVPAPELAARLGLGALHVKDESANPTGSFKARGMAVAVSRLADLGVARAFVPSAGNAGLALAAYCAAARIPCHVFIPSETPEGVAEECRLYGAEVTVVPGLLPDAARALDAFVGADRSGVTSTFREPCRVEGKKTMAFELHEQIEPDCVVFPTGGGTGIVAFWKAYRELDVLGLLRKPMPRLFVVQADGCAPLVEAWRSGRDRARPWPEPRTIASGIRVPGSRADAIILAALRESGGGAVAVSDGEIAEGVRELARALGLFVSPESGAAWAGLKRLAGENAVSPSARVALVSTAGGARYRFLLDGRLGA